MRRDTAAPRFGHVPFRGMRLLEVDCVVQNANSSFMFWGNRLCALFCAGSWRFFAVSFGILPLLGGGTLLHILLKMMPKSLGHPKSTNEVQKGVLKNNDFPMDFLYQNERFLLVLAICLDSSWEKRARQDAAEHLRKWPQNTPTFRQKSIQNLSKSTKMKARSVPRTILEARRFQEPSLGGPGRVFFWYFGATWAILGAILDPSGSQRGPKIASFQKNQHKI